MENTLKKHKCKSKVVEFPNNNIKENKSSQRTKTMSKVDIWLYNAYVVVALLMSAYYICRDLF